MHNDKRLIGFHHVWDHVLNTILFAQQETVYIVHVVYSNLGNVGKTVRMLLYFSKQQIIFIFLYNFISLWISDAKGLDWSDTKYISPLHELIGLQLQKIKLIEHKLKLLKYYEREYLEQMITVSMHHYT